MAARWEYQRAGFPAGWNPSVLGMPTSKTGIPARWIPACWECPFSTSTGNAILIRIFSSETTGPIFTKYLHNVVALVALLNLPHTWRYPIPFLNDRAISAGGRQFCPIFAQNRLPWQCPLRYRKKGSRSIICTQKAFVRCKDCENRFSGS